LGRIYCFHLDLEGLGYLLRSLFDPEDGGIYSSEMSIGFCRITWRYNQKIIGSIKKIRRTYFATIGLNTFPPGTGIFLLTCTPSTTVKVKKQ
jgi:hypothetical protein